ncbi:hypothetical protein [Legionella sp. km772]|nr:hypothetical protein [Legionella sp. km772]
MDNLLRSPNPKAQRYASYPPFCFSTVLHVIKKLALREKSIDIVPTLP